MAGLPPKLIALNEIGLIQIVESSPVQHLMWNQLVYL